MRAIPLLIFILLISTAPNSTLIANQPIAAAYTGVVAPPIEKKAKKRKLRKSRANFKKTSGKRKRYKRKPKAIKNIGIVEAILISTIALVTGGLIYLITLIYRAIKYGSRVQKTWKYLHDVSKKDAEYKYNQEVKYNYPYLPANIRGAYTFYKYKLNHNYVLVEVESQKRRPSFAKESAYMIEIDDSKYKLSQVEALYKKLDVQYKKIQKITLPEREHALKKLYLIGDLEIEKIILSTDDNQDSNIREINGYINKYQKEIDLLLKF